MRKQMLEELGSYIGLLFITASGLIASVLSMKDAVYLEQSIKVITFVSFILCIVGVILNIYFIFWSNRIFSPKGKQYRIFCDYEVNAKDPKEAVEQIFKELRDPSKFIQFYIFDKKGKAYNGQATNEDCFVTKENENGK